jgi:hypothetical protein
MAKIRKGAAGPPRRLTNADGTPMGYWAIGCDGPGTDELRRLDGEMKKIRAYDAGPLTWRGRLEERVRWFEDLDPDKIAFARAILLGVRLQVLAAEMLNAKAGGRRRRLLVQQINAHWRIAETGRVSARRDEDVLRRLALMTFIDDAQTEPGDADARAEAVLARYLEIDPFAESITKEALAIAIGAWPQRGGKQKHPKWEALRAVFALAHIGAAQKTMQREWGRRRLKDVEGFIREARRGVIRPTSRRPEEQQAKATDRGHEDGTTQRQVQRRHAVSSSSSSSRRP